MRANGVLGDEEALRDLVGAEVLVEKEEHLELAGRERRRDRVGDAGAAAVAVAHLLEQAPRDRAGQSGFSVDDPVEERRDPLGRLRLQEIAGRARRGSRRAGSPRCRRRSARRPRVSGAASRRRGSAPRPSRPGIERSSRMRSGRSRAASKIAASPSGAQPHTSNPCAPSSEESASRVRGWSSTIRTLAAIPRSYRQRPFCRQEGSGKDQGADRVPELAPRGNPPRGPARRQPGALPELPGAPDLVRPAGAAARAPDDDDPRRPPRRGPRRRPVLHRGPPGRPPSRERLLRHLALVRRLRDRAPLRRPRGQARRELVGADRRDRRHGAHRGRPLHARSQQVPRLVDRERRRGRGDHALRRVVAAAGARPDAAGPQPSARPAAVLPDRHARPPGSRDARRGRRLGRALRPPRRRPRTLARARVHAHALRCAPSRVPAALRELARVAGRLPAHARVRRLPRRRVARDSVRRVRACGRRRARSRRAGDPRRPRAVPLRRLDPRCDARGRGARRGVRAADQAGGRARATGGALRDPGALVGERHRALRRRASPLRRRA